MFDYLFIDEGGNLDFSDNGTRYFCLSCVTIERPFLINQLLDNYKYDCLEWGLEMDHFHCTEDNSHVRSKIFGYIQQHISNIRIKSIILEKQFLHPDMRDVKKFYSRTMGTLLRGGILHPSKLGKKLIIVTDRLPTHNKKAAFEKAIKHELATRLPPTVSYKILHHISAAHYGLQIADYCNWAIFRKWERGNMEYYDAIKDGIDSEFNLNFIL